MGLIKAAAGAAGGAMADQWKEYFYCESLPNNVLVSKGLKRTSGRSSNRKGSDNIISSGSVIAVADGQCMMIVDQGRVAEVSAEAGEFIFDASTEPTVFSGDLSESVAEVFRSIGRRFTAGGEPPKDQRVYYFNTKEILGNKYGTPNPVPFRVVDMRAGIDMDINVRCFGEYSFRITNPLLFYENISGNIGDTYTREDLDGQIRSDILTALQPAFAKISEMGIRYSALPGHAGELSAVLNEELSSEWKDTRGIEIVSFGVSSIKAEEEDEKMIKEMQRNAAFMDPLRAAAHLTGAQAEAMKAAAQNEGAGAAMAFMGMNMAGQSGGINAGDLYKNSRDISYKGAPGAAPAAAAAPAGWTCTSCGTLNKGKFCTECGAAKPAGVPQYKCDKCGWEPSDPSDLPRFCPECGDPFDDGDIKR